MAAVSLLAVVEASARGIAEGGAYRHVAAAMMAAAVRVVLGCSVDSIDVQHETLFRRLLPVHAGVAARGLLNTLNGSPSHNLGLALAKGRALLPKDISVALRKLQKMANDAKHD